MSYNLIFIDESESLQRAVSTIFLNNPEFNLTIVSEPSALYKAAKNFIPDIIVLGYNTINTELKKSITEIKTSHEFSNVPLILLVPSDLSDNERETLIKLKADGFIYRPFEKETFISKIKRTLNVSNTVSNASINSVNAENTPEKIYDVGDLEIKKTEENSAAIDTGGDNKKPENTGLESSELSRAFENLFKDDAIFKEFKDLNKKEESEQETNVHGGYIIEDTEKSEPSEPEQTSGTAEQVASTAEIAEPAEQFASSAGTAGTAETAEQFTSTAEIAEPAEQFASSTETAGTAEQFFASSAGPSGQVASPEEPAKPEPEPDAAVMPENIFAQHEPPSEPADSAVSFISEFNSPSEPVKPVGIFELDAPEDAFESAVSFDSISSNYKLNADTNTNESKGELNLKIFDEQNLVKLEDYLKNAVEKTMDDIKPQIIEAVKTSLPEIIEKLVKEEIEKIKLQ